MFPAVSFFPQNVLLTPWPSPVLNIRRVFSEGKVKIRIQSQGLLTENTGDRIQDTRSDTAWIGLSGDQEMGIREAG